MPSLTNSGASASPSYTAKVKRFWSKEEAGVIKVKQEQYVEVKRLPIDVLADLWAARYGYEWVGIKDISGEDFYCAVAQRLLNEFRMDRQTLANQMTTVFRLKEL